MLILYYFITLLFIILLFLLLYHINIIFLPQTILLCSKLESSLCLGVSIHTHIFFNRLFKYLKQTSNFRSSCFGLPVLGLCACSTTPALYTDFFVFWVLLLFGVLFCFVWDRVSLCSPGCPGTHSVDQAGLELRYLPASASRVPPRPAVLSVLNSQCLKLSVVVLHKFLSPMAFSIS